MEQATIGGGCFWCLDALYSLVKGVTKVESGFAGGGMSDGIKYSDIHSGNTSHAEVVHLTFDPKIITYEEILKIFFGSHNPTTPNQQGADIGPEYRSIILHKSEEQKKVAEKVVRQFAVNLWDEPIVTQIVPFDKFTAADENHQDYFNKNPNAGYCQVVINPKLAKFRKSFKNYLKD